ncbi:MAG: hypothetical protein ACOX6V_05660 [Patescibacteria group bacterium]|jgi:hypothetical protein
MTNTFEKEIAGAVARGWCHPKNSNKEMDSDLAMAIVKEVLPIVSKTVLESFEEEQKNIKHAKFCSVYTGASAYCDCGASKTLDTIKTNLQEKGVV